MSDDKKKPLKGKETTANKSSKKNTVILNPQLDDKPDSDTVSFEQPEGRINETALNTIQRLHRGQVMRRIQPKLKRAREIAQSRIATDDKLKQRATRKARDFVRDRIAGQGGIKYEKMEAGQKQMIDKQLEAKVGLIKRLAARLYPKVRQAERDRHSAHTHKDMINTDHLPTTKMVVKEAVSARSGDYAQLLATRMDAHHGETYDHPVHGKSNKVTRDVSAGSGHGTLSSRESGHYIKRDNYHKVPEAKLKAAEDEVIRSKPKIKVKTPSGTSDAYVHGKHIVVDRGYGHFSVHSKNKYKKINEAYQDTDGAADTKHTTRYKEVVIVGKDGKKRTVTRAVSIKAMEEGLQKKADKSGIPLEAIHEVFERGLNTYNSTKYPMLTREQYAFARVNKFIADQSIDEDLKTRFKSAFRGTINNG